MPSPPDSRARNPCRRRLAAHSGTSTAGDSCGGAHGSRRNSARDTPVGSRPRLLDRPREHPHPCGDSRASLGLPTAAFVLAAAVRTAMDRLRCEPVSEAPVAHVRICLSLRGFAHLSHPQSARAAIRPARVRRASTAHAASSRGSSRRGVMRTASVVPERRRCARLPFRTIGHPVRRRRIGGPFAPPRFRYFRRP